MRPAGGPLGGPPPPSPPEPPERRDAGGPLGTGGPLGILDPPPEWSDDAAGAPLDTLCSGACVGTGSGGPGSVPFGCLLGVVLLFWAPPAKDPAGGSLGCHHRCAEVLWRYLVSRVVARCGQRGPEWYHRHHVSAGDRPDESHNASPTGLDELVPGCRAGWLRHGRSDRGTLRTCLRTSCQTSSCWHEDGQENGPSQEHRDQRSSACPWLRFGACSRCSKEAQPKVCARRRPSRCP